MRLDAVSTRPRRRLLDWQAPHNRLALRLVLMVWLASLSIFLPVAFANHSTDYSIVLDSFNYDSGNNLSTYTWKLTTTGNTDGVSHVVIDTCLGNTAQSTGGSPDSSAEYKNPDPSTGSTGYKWETTGDLPVGSTFILKFTGNKGQSGTSNWTIKKGPDGHEKNGTAAGPSCGKSNVDPFETQSSEQGTVQPGTSVTDTATVSGTAGDPSGTVSFYLCGPGGVPTGCLTTTNKIGSDMNLSGGTSSSSSATSEPAAPTASGRYCWRAEYSGDSNYNSDSHTNNTTECFDVASSSSTSSGTTTTAVLGTQVTAEGNAETTVVAGELPKTGPVPTLPALILALDLIGAGWIMRKLAILEELEKAKL